jgi:hypothetical protein
MLFLACKYVRIYARIYASSIQALRKEDAFFLRLAAEIAHINCACSQLLVLWVLLDTYLTFNVYLLPW